MGLVIEARFNAVKSNIAQEPVMLRYMKQGKLVMVKQKMARLNTDILGNH